MGPPPFPCDPLYDDYGRYISSSHAEFLRNHGIRNVGVRATGSTITDSAGKTYIDCVGGYGVNNIGHNHPVLVRELTALLSSCEVHTKPFVTEPAVRLARALSALSEAERFVIFCNSGSEAVDNAIKLARLSSGRKRILSAENSFHGFTYGALSVSGIRPFTRPFQPLVQGIGHVPYGDVEALRAAVTPDTAAILLEPVQHEAGIVAPGAEYFRAVRDLCDGNGILLILDEIKTGCGRAGHMFLSDAYGIRPDMILLGKSLGGGIVPVGAVLADRKFMKRFGLSFAMSASSYAGNALACRAALATLEILQAEGLAGESSRKGAALLDGFRECLRRHPGVIRSARGVGLLIGLEMRNPDVAHRISGEMIREGILVLPAFGKGSVLMIEPPLVISDGEMSRVVRALDEACGRVQAAGRGD